jgi:hypothetical protein
MAQLAHQKPREHVLTEVPFGPRRLEHNHHSRPGPHQSLALTFSPE